MTFINDTIKFVLQNTKSTHDSHDSARKQAGIFQHDKDAKHGGDDSVFVLSNFLFYLDLPVFFVGLSFPSFI